MGQIKIGLVGLGKISVDQHVPTIRENPDFDLVGGISPRSSLEGLKSYSNLEALIEATGATAVAINTPPQVRFAIAKQAILAGIHVLLEKPPCASVNEILELERLATRCGVTLYTGWHSQHAPAVDPARLWLENKTVQTVNLHWAEDVRKWHPGQKWIWQPGGLGVFDPGINAFSILTHILPERIRLSAATLELPGNCFTPIAADLEGDVGAGGRFQARFDFLQTGLQTWTISIGTNDGVVELSMGGAELSINGRRENVGPSNEYPSMYRRFADLIGSGQSAVDCEPLILTADAFLIGRRVNVAEFHE